MNLLRFVAYAGLISVGPAALTGATIDPPLAATAREPGRLDPLPHLSPSEVGMSAERLSAIDGAMTKAIAAGGFPGGAVIIGRRGAIVWEKGYGALDWRGTQAVDPQHTLYDLASLTKVVATATATMVLVDNGRLRLDDPVGRYIPEFDHGLKARVTIRDLLTHRSGLPAGRDLARGTRSIADARRAVLSTPLVRPPGERTEYSDLGPDVLAFVVERVTGQPFDAFVAGHVFAPLGMRQTVFRPTGALRGRAAPTVTPTTAGIVHDGNARALGGVAGHAGLFSTAGDLAVFAQMMLNRGATNGVRIASDSAVALFTRRTAGWRALGWDTCAGGGSCGQRMSPLAFGHTGFTGTSIWIDPVRELFVIVLTNTVLGLPQGGEAPIAILHDAREDVADLAMLSVADDGDMPPMPWRLRSDLQIGWRP